MVDTPTARPMRFGHGQSARTCARVATCRRVWGPPRPAAARQRMGIGIGGRGRHVCGCGRPARGRCPLDAPMGHAVTPRGAGRPRLRPPGVDWTPSRAVRRRLTCLTRQSSPEAAAVPAVDVDLSAHIQWCNISKTHAQIFTFPAAKTEFPFPPAAPAKASAAASTALCPISEDARRPRLHHHHRRCSLASLCTLQPARTESASAFNGSP